MKKLVLIFCLVMLLLTLASDTQHRFKVYVDGNDEQVINTIESHLKRELRLLGDIGVVSNDDDWEYILEIFVIAQERKDGTKTGNYVIGTYNATRMSESLFKKPLDYALYPKIFGILGALSPMK